MLVPSDRNCPSWRMRGAGGHLCWRMSSSVTLPSDAAKKEKPPIRVRVVDDIVKTTGQDGQQACELFALATTPPEVEPLATTPPEVEQGPAIDLATPPHHGWQTVVVRGPEDRTARRPRELAALPAPGPRAWGPEVLGHSVR